LTGDRCGPSSARLARLLGIGALVVTTVPNREKRRDAQGNTGEKRQEQQPKRSRRSGAFPIFEGWGGGRGGVEGRGWRRMGGWREEKDAERRQADGDSSRELSKRDSRKDERGVVQKRKACGGFFGQPGATPQALH